MFISAVHYPFIIQISTTYPQHLSWANIQSITSTNKNIEYFVSMLYVCMLILPSAKIEYLKSRWQTISDKEGSKVDYIWHVCLYWQVQKIKYLKSGQQKFLIKKEVKLINYVYLFPIKSDMLRNTGLWLVTFGDHKYCRMMSICLHLNDWHSKMYCLSASITTYRLSNDKEPWMLNDLVCSYELNLNILRVKIYLSKIKLIIYFISC